MDAAPKEVGTRGVAVTLMATSVGLEDRAEEWGLQCISGKAPYSYEHATTNYSWHGDEYNRDLKILHDGGVAVVEQISIL